MQFAVPVGREITTVKVLRYIRVSDLTIAASKISPLPIDDLGSARTHSGCELSTGAAATNRRLFRFKSAVVAKHDSANAQASLHVRGRDFREAAFACAELIYPVIACGTDFRTGLDPNVLF